MRCQNAICISTALQNKSGGRSVRAIYRLVLGTGIVALGFLSSNFSRLRLGRLNIPPGHT